MNKFNFSDFFKVETFGLNKDTIRLKGVVDMYNTVTGLIVTVLVGIFGEFWFFFVALAILNIADFASGCYKARQTKTESSQKGFEGFVKKVWQWVVVGVAFMVAGMINTAGDSIGFIGVDLSFLSVIGWFALACFIINELRSLTENLLVAGVKIPNFIIKGLAIAQKLIEDKADQSLPDIDTAEQSGTKTEI